MQAWSHATHSLGLLLALSLQGLELQPLHLHATALKVAAAGLLLAADFAAAEFGTVAIYNETLPTGVVLPSICIGDAIVPKTMYTFEPSGVDDIVEISSDPPDLIEVGMDEEDGRLYFKYNLDVSDLADSAGVLISFPPDQLESINICCTQTAQVKAGFTNFKSLTATTSSVVDVEFDAVQETDLAIIVQSNAEVNAKVSTTGKIGVLAEYEAMVCVDGDLTNLACGDESTCLVAGTIGEGLVEGYSMVNTTSCEGVQVAKESYCEPTTPDVSVDTSKDLVISGVKEYCLGGEDLFGVNGPAPTFAPTVSPAPTASSAPSTSPTSAPTSGAFNTAKQGALMSFALGGAVMLLLLGQ